MWIFICNYQLSQFLLSSKLLLLWPIFIFPYYLLSFRTYLDWDNIMQSNLIMMLFSMWILVILRELFWIIFKMDFAVCSSKFLFIYLNILRQSRISTTLHPVCWHIYQSVWKHSPRRTWRLISNPSQNIRWDNLMALCIY